MEEYRQEVKWQFAQRVTTKSIQMSSATMLARQILPHRWNVVGIAWIGKNCINAIVGSIFMLKILAIKLSYNIQEGLNE